MLKHVYCDLFDEQIEHQLLYRKGYEGFCGPVNATNIQDRTKVSTFENRIDDAGTTAASEDDLEGKRGDVAG